MIQFRHLAVAAGMMSALMATGATVTYYEEAIPSTMNPLFAKTMADHRSHELVFDRLFFRSSVTNVLQSRLVSTYEKLDGGKKLKLVLNDGIKWHDNKKFTPGDVCFTIEAMLNEDTPSTVAKEYRESIAGCEAVTKENAVVVEFKRVYHNPRERVAFPVLPKHMFPSTTVMPDMDFSTRPVGTGAMKGNRGRREVKFTTFQNAHHDAAIDVLVQRETGDPMGQIRTLLANGVQGMISVPPTLRSDVKASDEVALKRYDLRSWWFMAINMSSPNFSDHRVRQALDYALDRDDLRAKTIGVDPDDANPPCEFITGPFVQSSSYYNQSIKPRNKRDLEKSKSLMTEVGAVNQAGRWVLNGQPVALRIGMKTSLDVEAKDLLNQLGNQLEDAGFATQVYKVSNDDWTKEVVTGRMGSQYDALIGKWSFGVREDVNPMFETRDDGQGIGSRNIFNYSNAEVDKILARFNAAKTDTEAQDAYHDLHAYLSKDLPYIFLWRLDTKSAWRNEVRGNMIAPYFYFTDFDGWKM